MLYNDTASYYSTTVLTFYENNITMNTFDLFTSKILVGKLYCGVNILHRNLIVDEHDSKWVRTKIKAKANKES